MKKIIYYLPRILAIFIVAFFAAFILEGFSPEFSWQDSLAHSVLALIALFASAIAWKRPGIGGWIFVAFGAYYLLEIFRSQWWGGLIIGGIPLLAGILFLVEGSKKRSAAIENKPDKNKK
jgi:hypothetical protein